VPIIPTRPINHHPKHGSACMIEEDTFRPTLCLPIDRKSLALGCDRWGCSICTLLLIGHHGGNANTRTKYSCFRLGRRTTRCLACLGRSIIRPAAAARCNATISFRCLSGGGIRRGAYLSQRPAWPGPPVPNRVRARSREQGPRTRGWGAKWRADH
jgi:hypothetical protein